MTFCTTLYELTCAIWLFDAGMFQKEMVLSPELADIMGTDRVSLVVKNLVAYSFVPL